LLRVKRKISAGRRAPVFNSVFVGPTQPIGSAIGLQHLGGFLGIQQAIVETEAALSQSLSDFLAHG